MTITNLKGDYFYGDLVQDEHLDKVAKEKENQYEEISIDRSELNLYLKQGWEVKKQIKNKIIFKKKKELDKLLEEEVWLIFKNMDFEQMNKDRNFKIQSGSHQKQIDVYAKDPHNIFVIFCTSQEKLDSSNFLKGKIHEISDLKRDISLSIKNYYDKKFRISFLLITRNIIWNENEKKLASDKGIFFWKDEDLEAYKILVEQLGPAAKYQMYGLLFYNKKASEVEEITVPAMRGGIGKDKYYCFLIQPEKLFKIAYVNRREKSNPKQVGTTYQRMVKKERLEQIRKFIDDGNSFPNSIIISFKKPPDFKPFPKIKEILGISYGILKFPPHYGCAWIIDGQHRLYGYCKSKHATDHTIPVIAFHSKNIKDQANLFVDINKEQKSVNQNLLWDLYPDIYENSEDEKQQKLRAISLIAKKLDSDENSPFYERIQIPSLIVIDKEKSNLTLTNICDAIEENLLINENELLYNQNYENSIDLASEVIKAYFEEIASYLKEDWENGEYGLVRTNVGVRILFIILKQLLRELYRQGKNNLYRKKDLTEFKSEVRNILAPILYKLKNMEAHRKNEIRSGSSKGLVLRNTQMLIWDLKEETGFGLELWNTKNAWNPGIPETETDKNIIELIDDTEIKLRKIIIKKLREHYDENWWKQGIPPEIKEGVDRVVEQEKSKFPWKVDELNSLSDEKKLTFSLTSHLKEIIINGNNWNLFMDKFYKYKNCVEVQFGFYENFRNKYKHPERVLKLDDVEKGLGYYIMCWIRKCIGLNPKKVT